MRRIVAILMVLVTSFAPLTALAQSPAPAREATPAIRVSTRVVLVDVIASKDNGAPVTDLKADDFSVEESGKKEKIAFFSSNQAAQATDLPTLPPNVYSNRPQYTTPSGPLTVILIDALNTPVRNQQFAREQLLRFTANQFKAGQRAAVYALASHLTKLQDFTADAQTLRIAIDKFFPHTVAGTVQAPSEPAHASSAIATMTGLNGNVENTAQLATISAVRGIQDFEAQESSFNLQIRTGTTVQALRMLANSLAGYPGRKNLVWIAALYPFQLVPEDVSVVSLDRVADPTAPPPLPNETSGAVQANQISNAFNDDIRKTTTMLSDAQIALYPVDARGLFNNINTADASSSGLDARGLLQMGQEYGNTVAFSGAAITSEQAVMSDLAVQSGGKAFKNRNDIDNSVALASEDGSSYYSLGYYPDKKKFDGSFRRIKISTNRPGVHLRYRTGYFAFDTTKASGKDRDMETMNTLATGVGANKVYFDAQVMPPTQPANPAHVPVKFLVQSNSFTAEDTGKGSQKINLDFFVGVMNKEGKLVQVPRLTVDTALTADQFAQVQKMGLLVPMDLQLAPGDYDLRLAVRDNRTGYVGSLSAPLTVPK